MSDHVSGRGGEKAAIVTAAGSGMGTACARELASRGYAVALMSPSGKAHRSSERSALCSFH
jgi:NAD(P)-dependent dehydrogenase (short-subunit alcohol dehydrogenase family)